MWDQMNGCQSYSVLFRKKEKSSISYKMIGNIESESGTINRIFGHPAASKKRGEMYSVAGLVCRRANFYDHKSLLAT